MPFTIRWSLFILLLVAAPSLAAAETHNAISLQGFTGLLNTPNALTTDAGKIYLSYSNQEESQWRNKTPYQDNYLMSLGLFDFIEIGARLFDAPRAGRDLSANLKVRIPFIPKGDYLPQVALGMQDIGGGSTLLQTNYVVASEEIWRFRFSVGYGSGPDRMKGVFGGMEVKACDWFYLLAEHDTRERNVGMRLVTPSIFGYPVNLQATVKSSLDHSPRHPDFAVGLQFPLGLEHDYKKPLPIAHPSDRKAEPGAITEKTAPPETSATAQTAPLAAAGTSQTGTSQTGTSQSDASRTGTRQALQHLLKRLTADGFQNVRVGSSGKVLVVEYENSRYNHNEVDGIGVVAGIAQQEAPPSFDTLRLIEKKKSIRMVQLDMPMKELRAFLGDAANLGTLQDALRVTSEIADTAGVSFVTGDDNSSLLKADLMLYPGLITYLGTEVGVFDYLVSLKPDLYINLWTGAALDTRADIPVAWSGNFEDGRMFRRDRHDPRLDRLMIFQGVKPASSLMAVLGAGMVLAEKYGTLNELAWTPGDGNHKVKLSQLWARGSDGGHVDEQYLGSYRYYYSPLDLYLQGTAGKFLTGDRGFVADLKRFFGDTSVSVFYKFGSNDGKNHQAAGIQFDLPLTPRRDMKPYLLQVRGSNDWSYAQETAIATSGNENRNSVGTSIGAKLVPLYSVDQLFYNRDRLSEQYIRKHLLRLRDAYRRYVVPATEAAAR